MSGMSSEQFMQRLADFIDRFERTLPATPSAVDWSSTFAARWSMEGQLCQLRPLQVSLSLRLDDLVGVDRQKQLLESNTGQFVRGLPANNALLWGARGTGKSSLVRALLSEHAQAGMRLIEVDKADLVHLSALLPLLAGQPWRFVLFCDDLAFEADDSGYKALKTVLDGTVEASPENILLYATSNRRHLLPEHNSDNLSARQVDGEIHPGEAIEEKIALSDRFGLWVSFYPFSQEHYLAVVQKWLGQLAGEYGLQWQWDEPLQLEALRWATGRGNRNGRCAYQFARSWVGRQLLGN